METPDQNLSQQARAYFLQQGAGINKLTEILNSNVFIHHLNRWWSFLLEFALYLTFLIGLICLCGVAGKEGFIFGLVSLPSPFIAMLLRRNRKRAKLIHQAAQEIEKMKLEFDNAVKNLKF